jgi:hypothetical protein
MVVGRAPSATGCKQMSGWPARSDSKVNMQSKKSTEIQIWSIDKLVAYTRNPRKNDKAVDLMCGSIREFGFKIPCLVRSDGELIDGHLRLKAARKLGITDILVILCDEWSPAQVAAMVRGKSSRVSVGKNKVGRNDPCPCGSGKKFKKCRGL